jgi:Zn-dependent protease with chaperone function
MKPKKIIPILFLILCISCATVPITGRSQLMMMSKAEEERIGEVAFYNFIIPLRNQGKIIFSNDPRPEMRKYVSRAYGVLSRIMNATGWQGEYKWKCAVVDNPNTTNAAMYPGGKMVIYTGMLNFIKSDDELALIMGHEVAHAIARHAAERFSQITAIKLTAAAIDIAVASSKKYSKYGNEIHVAVGLGAEYGILLPYSRLHENEADYIGLLIMAKAGYDPRSAIQFWERMGREHPYRHIQFLATHPSHGTRISNLEEWLPLAMQYNKDPSKPLPTKKVRIEAPKAKKPTPPAAPIPTPVPLPPKEAPPKAPEIKVAGKAPTQIPGRIESPVLNVGDSWTFRDEYDKEWDFKVVRLEGDLYIIEGPDPGELFAYDKNTMDIKYKLDQKGQATQTIYDTKLYFDFPLYKGKKWIQMVTAPPSHGISIPNTYIREYECISFEDMKVKAGAFKALKIKLKSTNITRGVSGDGWIWYSPQVKKHIKAIFEGPYFIGVPNYELVSFKLG